MLIEILGTSKAFILGNLSFHFIISTKVEWADGPWLKDEQP